MVVTRTAIRTIFIVALTLWAMICEGSDLALPWHPDASFGFFLSRQSVVVAVESSTSGVLHVGDRVDVARMTPADRFALGHVVEPGRILHLPLVSGQTLTLAAQVQRRTVADNVSDIIEVLAMLAYLILAAALVLFRPMPSTWAFYIFSLSFCTFAATPNMWPFAFAMFGFPFFLIMTSLSPVAFLAFALRFPAAKPIGVAKRLEQVAIFVAAPLFAAFVLSASLGFIFAAWAPPNWINAFADALRVAGYAIGVIVLIARYFSAPADERNRLQWVVCAFGVAFLPFVLLTFFFDQGIYFASPTSINLCQALTVLAPIALAYTVLRHRLFDIRLVVSRALMYTLMTSLIVGAVTLIDWGFSKWLERSRFATFVELGLTLLLGAALMTLHRRIEHALNQVVFRAQALALAGLRRFAQETDLIADPQRLFSQTRDALRSRLEADYIALYTADGSSYALSTSQGAALPTILAADDLAVLRVRRWSEPFECDEPSHSLRGALFVPMTARTQLVGFIVCGPKRDRTHYLSEEIDTLSMLAHRVASSYMWLTLASSTSLIPSPSFEPPA